MIAGLMPVFAGVIGILAVARYGLDAGLAGYDNITRIASEISPVMGGVAIAAVLAAVISSGGPILLASATMLVRDWMPSSATYSSERRLKTYRVVTICYAVLAALVAWWLATRTDTSILDMLLFGFAMVVPPDDFRRVYPLIGVPRPRRGPFGACSSGTWVAACGSS